MAEDSIKNLTPATPNGGAPAGEGDDELRNLKTVLQASFPEVDGLITNAGGTDPTLGGSDTDPPNALTWSQLFTAVRSLTGGAGDSSFTLGMIMMWTTAQGPIPTGWTACNGTNVNNVEVPDMLDMFPVGAGGAYGDGTTGGSVGVGETGPGGGHTHATSDHVLTLAQLPSDLGTTGIELALSGDDQADASPYTDSVHRGNTATNSKYNTPVSVAGVNSEPHAHGDVATADPHTHSLTGAVPPYRALTFICYVGV
jgi:hypothetical protein